ncbi:hypothetical protein UFOVP434_76 [uncultured Caudovirales phage]|uniref:Uncharacterized protein n=1 Tax=uncultured Caudovirales phage TaxID=2100421 RepID=A0A6J5MA90_9CAUD|nr:hypothetical protein UFOVP434_76 [uncultured Caudovirales phage]
MATKKPTYDINNITESNFLVEIYKIPKAEFEDNFYEICVKYLRLRNVPEKYIDRVFSYAYSSSHAHGYHEVAGTLVDLSEIFND